MSNAAANQTFGPFRAGTTSSVPTLLGPDMYEWNFNEKSANIDFRTPYPGLYDGQATAIIQNGGSNNSFHSTGSEYGPRLQAGEVWSMSLYFKPGTKNALQFQVTNPSRQRLTVVLAINNSYASSYDNPGNAFDINYLNWQKFEQENGWWWCFITFSSRVSGIHTVSFALNDQPSTTLSPNGAVLATVQGLMLTKTSSGTRYYTAGGTGRVTTPLRMVGDQTFDHFPSKGRGLALYSASAETTIAPMVQEASGNVYPILLGSGDASIGPFASSSAARIISAFTGNQTIAPFIQAAAAEKPVIRSSANRTIAPFVTDAPGIPAFIDASLLVEGTASTARSVTIPSAYGRKRGDAVFLIAGAHSDGARPVAITAPSDFALVGTVSAPSAKEGYFQTLSIWWRYVRPTDTNVQVLYGLPAEYSDPVVWARAAVFRNVGSVESALPEVTAGTTIKSHDIGIGGPDRLAVFVAQFSRALNQQRPGDGWVQQMDEFSYTGPGFGSILDYRPGVEPGTIPRTTTLSTSQPVSTLSIGFAIVPNRTEAHVSVVADANQNLGVFESIRDAHAAADQVIEPFVQDALLNLYRITGQQVLAPFTQVASCASQAGLTAAMEVSPFGQDANGLVAISGASSAMLSLGDFASGIILSKAAGATAVPAATSEAAGEVSIGGGTVAAIPALGSAGQLAAIVTAAGASQIETFLTNVFNAQADQEIEPFTAYGEGLHDVPERLRGKAAIEPFTSWTWAFSPARSNTLAAGESTIDAFASGIIEGFGAGESAVEGFHVRAIAQVAVAGTGSSQIEVFEQDAGNNVFIRAKQTFDDFLNEEAAVAVTVASDTSVSVGLFESEEAEVQVLASSSLTSAIDPFNLGAEARVRVRTSVQTEIEPFGQQADALDPDPKPPTHGGIRISGGFKPFGRLRFYGHQVGRR